MIFNVIRAFFCALVIVSMFDFNNGTIPEDFVIKRIDAACQAEKDNTMVEIFDCCVREKNIGYSLKDIFKGCGNNEVGTSTWEGIYACVCSDACNKDKTKKCIVKNMKREMKLTNKEQTIDASEKAFEICKKCADDFPQYLEKWDPKTKCQLGKKGAKSKGTKGGLGKLG